MKLAATIARSLQADLQAELRDIERAVAAGTRSRPRPQDRAAPAGEQRRARPAARQQLARQALPEPEARRREPGLHVLAKLTRRFFATLLARPERGRADLALPARALALVLSHRLWPTYDDNLDASGGLEGFGRRGRPHQLPLFLDWRRRSLPYWAGIGPLGAHHGAVNSTSSTRSPDTRSRSRISPTPEA